MKINRPKLRIKIFFLFSIFYFLISVTTAPVLATDCQPPGGLMKEVSHACACQGNCSLNDILSIVVGVAKLILRWVGVLALVFFIVGGIIWLTSAGNPEQVKKGKSILVNTVIGLLIVFLAWQIVNLVICGLSQGQLQETCKIFGNEKWNVFPGEKKPLCFTQYPECPSLDQGGVWQANCKRNEVKNLQQILADHQCYHESIDGCYGPKTAEAVVAFCQKNGCRTDGKVDKTFFELMGPFQPCL